MIRDKIAAILNLTCLRPNLAHSPLPFRTLVVRSLDTATLAQC